jgi:ABC-type Mn2+/Zn2+ transport system ATPase subunit
MTTSEIRDVFKLVRLTASFPNVIYIVAFDRSRVEDALAEQGIPGRDYLEKILQVAVDLPIVPNQALDRQTVAAIELALKDAEAGPFNQEAWPDVFAEVVRPLIRSMRDVRRYAMSIQGTVTGLGRQIALVDVLTLEAVRVFLPDVFARLQGAVDGLTTTSSSTYGHREDPPELKSQVRQVVKFDFRVPPRSGEQVAVLENLHKSYGPRVIYEGFNLTIRRGERWAVMGRNGAGKTTLLKMIAGASAPDAGSVRLGASLYMGYFAQQSLDVLNSDLTVIEQLQQDFPQDGLGSLRNLSGAFQFSGDDVDKKIRALSGGEKSRLAIARMLYNPPNFLVLDEPTNHLDLATKEMLVDALKDFEGTMIFVSHDRMFLRGLGSRVLELGGESGTDRHPTVYPGSYVEYVQKLGHEAPGIYS